MAKVLRQQKKSYKCHTNKNTHVNKITNTNYSTKYNTQSKLTFFMETPNTHRSVSTLTRTFPPIEDRENEYWNLNVI